MNRSYYSKLSQVAKSLAHCSKSKIGVSKEDKVTSEKQIIKQSLGRYIYLDFPKILPSSSQWEPDPFERFLSNETAS